MLMYLGEYQQRQSRRKKTQPLMQDLPPPVWRELQIMQNSEQ